jgi:DNA-directed RNA polymerase specialized sigma24 family protein
MRHCMAQWKETRNEEKEKFSHEAMTHVDHLYRVALYLAKETDEAKDLVQETYSRAFGSYKQFTPGTNMKAWLTTILYNFFFHHRNQKKNGSPQKTISPKAKGLRIIGSKCRPKTPGRKPTSY